MYSKCSVGVMQAHFPVVYSLTSEHISHPTAVKQFKNVKFTQIFFSPTDICFLATNTIINPGRVCSLNTAFCSMVFFMLSSRP